ncbi:Transmembrane protein 208 [Balamuthia mandrillaris]
MANQAAKKRVKENEQIIYRLRWLIAIVNAIYVLVRVLWYNDSFIGYHWFAFALTTGVYLIFYSWLASLAKPTYEGTELVDGGANLSMPGNLTEYYFDIIYVTAFVQLGSIYSDWMWLLYLVIPIFAVYKLGGLLLSLRSTQQAMSGGEDDPSFQKKREKAERRAGRVKFTKGRR